MNQINQLANKQGSGKVGRFLPEDDEGFVVSVTEALTDLSSPTLTSSLAIKVLMLMASLIFLSYFNNPKSIRLWEYL